MTDKIYKINNIVRTDGNFDYKGFNIDLFVPGKLLYSLDFNVDNFAYITTTEIIELRHEDVTEVTQDEFDAYKELIKVTPVKSELAELKEQLISTQQALDFLILGGM